MEKVRISDIARQLGLSAATVSNVLRGKHEKISRETEKRVLEAIEATGYLPARAEVLLGRNPRSLIGFVTNDHPIYEGRPFSDSYHMESLAALIHEAAKRDLNVVPRSARSWEEVADFASTWNMKGLILSGFCQTDYENLRSQLHIPLIIYNASAPGLACVSNDDFEGGRLLGKYLTELGHASVLCLLFGRQSPDMDRVLGLQAAGLDTRILVVPASSHDRLAFYAAMDPVAETAVFCTSDQLALEFMHQPAFDPALSVCGFDGIAAGQYNTPSLTTIVQDHEAQAMAALSCLHTKTASIKIAGRLRKGRSVHEV